MPSQTKRTPPKHSQDSINTESLNEKLNKAAELEATLDKMKTKKGSETEAKAAAVRLELCSLLSDVVIVDPIFAVANNVVERLWKFCFYGRINELRVRINKEKSRAKKRAAGGSTSVSSKASDIVGDIEKQLQQFLKEAVALYSYLIKKYKEHLNDALEGSSQDDEEYCETTISSLYRMHIHLGDLYRYSSSIQKAEETYGKAAKLAPTTGNPFNQLAVVAQSQESQTVQALYYYSRSLMAQTPFETSRPNLVRLFESNSKWLAENDRGVSHNHTLVGVNKKAQKDWANKQKVAMTRIVMAKLVDLQFALFTGISLDDGDDKVDLNRLMDMMEKQLEGLDELLSSTGVSENLLCKILAVLAFSTLGAGNSGKLCSEEDLLSLDSGLNRGVVMNNQAIAFSFLLRFVSVLAKHTKILIEEKQAGGGKVKVGTIRPLSSLLLGVNFAASLYAGSKWFHGLPIYPINSTSQIDSSPIHLLCKESHYKFWESVADVANCFRGLDLVWMDGPTPPVCNDLKDFSDFGCFVPFESFLPRSTDGKYATLNEAIEALASNSSSTSKADEDEAITKIRLYLAVAINSTRSVDKEGLGPCYLVEDAISNNLKVLREDALQSTDEVMLLDNADNAFDGLDETEPTSQYSNLGVQLLTPAALLAKNAANEPPKKIDSAPNLLPDLVIAKGPKATHNLLPPPGLPPPPGFSGPPAHVNQQAPSEDTPTQSANVNSSLLSLLNQPQQQMPMNQDFGGFQAPSSNQVMPQAPNVFNTLNPFAISQRPTTEHQTGGIDLSFMLNNNWNKNNVIVNNEPSASADDPYSHGESLLKFLFESNSSDD